MWKDEERYEANNYRLFDAYLSSEHEADDDKARLYDVVVEHESIAEGDPKYTPYMNALTQLLDEGFVFED